MCETNIDECESDPCVEGDCIDQINGYECQCLPGYEGTNCDTEINECEKYTPCENAAVCVDKLADYSCTCAPENAEGKLYGGKNCTIELVGCEGNLCQSDSKCVPYLNETMQHVYRCDCLNGFTGRYCNFITTVSVKSGTWLKYNSADTTSINISLRFRTTLPDGVLILNLANLDSKYFVLVLKNGNTLEFDYNNSMVRREVQLQTATHVALNDGAWYTVDIGVDWSGVVLNLTHSDCGDADNPVCSVTESFQDSSLMHTLADTYFSYRTSDISDDVKSSVLSNLPGFVGCMEDIVVNDDAIIPLDYMDRNDATVTLTCERDEQCVPDACSGSGVCNDLWFEYSCTCNRPYRGLVCDQSKYKCTFHVRKCASVYVIKHPAIEVYLYTRKVRVEGAVGSVRF